MKTVWIMRGPSGCGKSTYASKLIEDGKTIVVSADHFFHDPDRGYDFNPSRLPEAHSFCLANFLLGIKCGVETIVVDNTFIRYWEYENYVTIAKLQGYEVKIVEFSVRSVSVIKKLVERNIHKVPEEVIERMVMNFQPDPDAYDIIEVS